MFFILLAFIFVFSIGHIIFGNNPPKWFYWICVAFMIMIGGFRYFVGVDYEAYKLMYELDNDSSNYLYYVEPSWTILYTIVHFLKGTYVLWFLVINAITLFFMTYGMRKQSPYIFLSLIFYVGSALYSQSFNTMRQCLAMSLVFAATPLIFQEKKRWCYVFVVIVAMSFHYSAGISLLLLLLKKQYNFTLVIGVLLFSAVFGDYLLTHFLIPLTEDFGALFSSVLDTRKNYVLDATEHDTMINSGLKKLVFNVLAIVILIFTKKWNDERVFYVNCFVVSIVIYNLFIGFMEYLRLHEYFFMYGMILFPLVVKRVKGNLGKWVAFMLLFYPILIFMLKDSINSVYQARFVLFE